MTTYTSLRSWESPTHTWSPHEPGAFQIITVTSEKKSQISMFESFHTDSYSFAIKNVVDAELGLVSFAKLFYRQI